MKKIYLGSSSLQIPQIAVGCMRLGELNEEKQVEWINWCIDHGLNFFDHADIYAGGESETMFAKAFKKNRTRSQRHYPSKQMRHRAWCNV